MKLGPLAIALLSIWSLVVPGATAQMRSTTSLDPLLPITPGLSPRPAESGADRFSQEARGPVAGFLESATVSDAVIEVIVGQGRILTLKEPIAREGGTAVVGLGDPTVVDIDYLSDRLIRLRGNRVGVTDLSMTTDAGNTYTFEVHVVYDMELMRYYLRQIFPDAHIELKQLREHVVLEGQARSTQQVAQIEQTLRSYLNSLQVPQRIRGGAGRAGVAPQAAPDEDGPYEEPLPEEEPIPAEEPPAAPAPITTPEARPTTRAAFAAAQIINLMRVPGVKQVMLKVQIAELNRTAFRQIGADLNFDDGVTNLSTFLPGVAEGATALGIFDSANFDVLLAALRQNSIVNVLAEPNLVALDGHEASFLAGGEFPFTIPQGTGTGGSTTFTIQFKPFGVFLSFIPTILDDETIRLRVAPEVSSLDFQNAIGVGGGIAVPSLQSRNVDTTVELRQGQTLALAGLLQVELDAATARIPGLGDLPYIGPLFSNTTHQRAEKELLVMVTPHLVSPMEPHQVPPAPGSEILDPNDLEFYLLNRIEGRTGVPFRSTTAWDDPQVHLLHLESEYICGPVGYSE